jgi:hypothetical protein
VRKIVAVPAAVALAVAVAAALVIAGGCEEPVVRGPDLQIVAESVKVMGDGARPAESALFDGKTVRLRGARGEVLGVQVLRRPGAAEIRLDLPGAVAAVRGFEPRFLEVTLPSSELFGESRGQGRYPDVLVPAASEVVRAERDAFFDVAIRPDATPGAYAGKLRVGGVVYPVELRIDPVTIRVDQDPIVWVFYDPRDLEKGGVAEETLYAALFREHGAYLATDRELPGLAERKHLMQGVRYWPVYFDAKLPLDRIVALVRGYADWFAAEAPGVTPFAIPVDEPRTDEQRRTVRAIGEAIDAAGIGADRFLLAVTDEPRAEYGGAVDLYISPKAIPPRADGPAQGTKRWTYNGRPPRAGSMILDTDGVALRTWGWIAFRYGVELWYVWHGLYFTDRYNDGGPTNVLKDPLTWDQHTLGIENPDYANGDGLLAYPGRMPSLRLKALRRGLQDRLLLRALAACDAAAADRIARSIVPRALGEAGDRGEGAWPVDERRFEAARVEILDLLAARCPDGAP